MRAVPTFRKGEVPRAVDFAALVAAVRELADLQGLTHVLFRRSPGRFYFPVAGECVARDDRDGCAAGVVAEWLWQCGEQVQLLPEGTVGGFQEAMERAGGGEVGVHGALRLKYHGYGVFFKLEAEGCEYAACSWEENAAGSDGTLDVGLMHGDVLAGCVLGEANVLHQRQRKVQMWAQPQYPWLVWRGLMDAAVDFGSAVLLPCGDFRQVLCWVPGGFYPEGDYTADFVRVFHCWVARLDVWGQLHFAAVNK